LKLPYKFEPREYQLPLLEAFDSGKRRLVAVWHRRAGKDKTAFNLMVREMYKRPGIYYYLFPTYAQGRKILWEGIDKDGLKLLDHIPPELIASKNDTELKITLKNGSLLRIIGTDRIDDIVGTNPIGCIFSEYSLQNPTAWDFIRPILRENGGWALFVFTPRGFNHAKELYDMARITPDWYANRLTITDTGVVSEAEIQQERAAGMDEDLIQQEFYASFSGAIQGSYYSKHIEEARTAGRIAGIPYDKALPVNTAWDLGIDDSMTIWFYQIVGKEIRFIDYYEVQGEGLDHCITVLQNKGYIYNEHTAPHDIAVRELTSGRARIDIARELGLDFNIAPRLRIEEGIDAARRVFNRCWFDEKKCKQGINALSNYRKEYDEKNKVYKNHPLHDWSSHAADSFRTFSVSFSDKYIRLTKSGDYAPVNRQAYNPMTV
jgi:phage terminase large subunit